MDETSMLTALKVDLGISTASYDERLRQYLVSAQTRIARRGITLVPGESVDDAQLVVAFAAWQWRHRATGEPMSQMLRMDLNDRVVAEKTGAMEDGDG